MPHQGVSTYSENSCDSEEQLEKYNCEWMCEINQNGPHEEKWHLSKVDYPDKGKGVARRSNGYSKAWKKAGRVPWDSEFFGSGVDPLRKSNDYHIPRHNSASTYSHPEYATEGHHLISLALFKKKKYPALVHNALLMGYDINHKKNGFHFPAFIVDIISHKLQHHASQHNWSDPAQLKYNLDDKVAPILEELQKQILPLCKTNNQSGIVKNLNQLSEVIRKKIVSWKWYLTKCAKMKLGEIRLYGITIDKVKIEGDNFAVLHNLKKKAKKAQLTLLENNLSLGGFPNFEHYINAALLDLDKGANPDQPFSLWLSKEMYKNKQKAK